MITAGKLAERSLKRNLVQASEAPLEADETQDFLDHLNDWMAALEVNSIRLGYTPVSNVSDYVTIPDGAVGAVVDNMAVYTAPDFNGTVTPQLERAAMKGMQVLRRLGGPRPITQYPSTLPRGSGSHRTTYNFSPLYDARFRSLSRLVESFGTAFTALNTPTRVLGEWSPEFSEGVSAYVSGRVENTSDLEVTVTVKAEFSATGDGDYTFHIVKNNVSQVSSASTTLSSTATAFTLTKSITLEPGEWVELQVEADTETNDVNLTLGEFRID